MPDLTGLDATGIDWARIADGTPLEIEADLRMQVTAPSGRTTMAHVTGHGRQVQVDVEHPDVLFAAAEPAAVGQVADLLAAAGVTVRVVGPDGPTATVGAGAGTRLGKVATGSSHVSPVPRAAARLALGMRPVQWAAAAVAGVVALVVLVRRLGRR